MNKQIRKIITAAVLGIAVVCSAAAAEKINRFKVVTRHNPHVTNFDSLSSLTVGNGQFAFTVDATGLQTFPHIYARGVPLGTMSEWGWHSFPNVEGFQAKDALANHDFRRGHPEYYSLQIKHPERTRKAVDYLRANPHRLHLGTIGLDISDTSKIRGVNQTLDLWTGKIDSKFEHEGVKYIPKKWERNILTPLEKDALKLVDWRCRAYMIPLLLPLIIRRGTMKKLP